jgi:hypothetical protein
MIFTFLANHFLRYFTPGTDSSGGGGIGDSVPRLALERCISAHPLPHVVEPLGDLVACLATVLAVLHSQPLSNNGNNSATSFQAETSCANAVCGEAGWVSAKADLIALADRVSAEGSVASDFSLDKNSTFAMGDERGADEACRASVLRGVTEGLLLAAVLLDDDAMHGGSFGGGRAESSSSSEATTRELQMEDSADTLPLPTSSETSSSSSELLSCLSLPSDGALGRITGLFEQRQALLKLIDAGRAKQGSSSDGGAGRKPKSSNLSSAHAEPVADFLDLRFLAPVLLALSTEKRKSRGNSESGEKGGVLEGVEDDDEDEEDEATPLQALKSNAPLKRFILKACIKTLAQVASACARGKGATELSLARAAGERRQLCMGLGPLMYRVYKAHRDDPTAGEETTHSSSSSAKKGGGYEGGGMVDGDEEVSGKATKSKKGKGASSKPTTTTAELALLGFQLAVFGFAAPAPPPHAPSLSSSDDSSYFSPSSSSSTSFGSQLSILSPPTSALLGDFVWRSFSPTPDAPLSGDPIAVVGKGVKSLIKHVVQASESSTASQEGRLDKLLCSVY